MADVYHRVFETHCFSLTSGAFDRFCCKLNEDLNVWTQYHGNLCNTQKAYNKYFINKAYNSSSLTIRSSSMNRLHCDYMHEH